MLFRPNPRLAAELRRQPAMRKALAAAAQPAADHAEALTNEAGAPWMRRPGARGPVVVTETEGEVAIVATDYGGAIIEFGGRNSPPHAPLRRGVQAAGLRLDEHPKT